MVGDGDGRGWQLMGKRLLSWCTVLVLAALHSAALGQGIVATYTSDGRLVYENAPEKPAVPAGLRDKSFYWSNTENRWKAIPPSYSQALFLVSLHGPASLRRIRNSTAIVCFTHTQLPSERPLFPRRILPKERQKKQKPPMLRI